MSKHETSKCVVAKFGGTSVRDFLAIKNCVAIVKETPEVKVVVVSATSQTTNHLEIVADCLRLNQKEEALKAYKKIVDRHRGICSELLGDDQLRGFMDELDFEGSQSVSYTHLRAHET